MTGLVVWSVLDVVALIAGLAVYLYWIGTLLNRVAAGLEECAGLVRAIAANAEVITPGVDHINQTGGVVAGALPLLYGMAEDIVATATATPSADAASADAAPADAAPADATPEPARPASGTRRSRLLSAVGFRAAH